MRFNPFARRHYSRRDAFTRSREYTRGQSVASHRPFLFKTNQGRLLLDRRSVKSGSRAIKRRPVSARVCRPRPRSRSAFCMINVQACGCFAYTALTNAHNSPQRHRPSWLMQAINCRVLKVGRIYISQGTFLPLFPYVIYNFQTGTNLEFIVRLPEVVLYQKLVNQLLVKLRKLM